MKQEKSCGAVVFRKKEGEPQILLICHRNGGHWAFPKGHVEKKETEEETALREIREETGLKVKLDTAFRTSVSYSPEPGVMKEVIYFAAKAEKDADPHRQEEEVLAIDWFSPEKALERVTYDNDRKVLESFLEYRRQKKAAKAARKADK